MTDSAVLLSLFLGSLLAATLLPGGSEILFFGVLQGTPRLLWAALAAATLGNTIGSLITFGMGWLLPRRTPLKHLDQLRRYGTPLLLLAWTPVVGDALCLAAGWLRLSPWRAALFIALGKLVRYAAIAWATV